jgi:hypothetical protein
MVVLLLADSRLAQKVHGLCCCAFSIDGSRLASVGDDKQLVVYSQMSVA